MMIEETFVPRIGISYRAYKPGLVAYMKSHGRSVKPYLQIYLWAYVITFRPLWRHEGYGEWSWLWRKKLGSKS